MTKGERSQAGFTLVEVLVSMAVGLLVLGAAVTLFKQSMDASFALAQRGEMQQAARAAMNSIGTDLSMAGTGMPYGGVALPSGSGSSPALFGCSAYTSLCYVNKGNGGQFVANQLTPVMTGQSLGAQTTQNTDSITIAYVDYTAAINQNPLASVSASGSSVTLTVNAAQNAAVFDQGTGIKLGDVLMLNNSRGTAVGVVTNLTPSSNTINLDSPDNLKYNQPGAASGNINSIGTGGSFTTTTASRLLVITYYIDNSAGTPRLMRQVNADNPAPVADNVENLQISYDIYNPNSAGSQLTTNLKDANGTPGLIKNVHLAVTARTQTKGNLQGNGEGIDYQRITLALNVAPRNLSFHDTYQ